MLAIYTIDGKMVYRAVATSDRVTIPVCRNAIYIVKTRKDTIKVLAN